MENKKRSFFERLTGSVNNDEEVTSKKNFLGKNIK